MKNIKLMNKIAKVGTDNFDKNEYNVGENVENAQAIMVRSAALHDMEFNSELEAIARCGAGVNNIPIERCTENGIVVFNTPGANANGVKELAICALILASRDVVGGIKWVETLKDEAGVAKLVEKGKSAYVGNELLGKTLGVIGLGAIGGMVANSANALGMNVVGYDPYLTPKAAWNLAPSIKQASGYEEIFKTCDYITLHVPATPTTKNMICEASLSTMKDGVKIINLSRADLVNATDIKKAIADKKVSVYVTDFPTEETVCESGIVNIPHLGASTFESEDNCAVMAAKQLDEYLKTGNIKNSVNFPAVSLPRSSNARICVMHKNIPNMLSQITTAISNEGVNIENLANGSKGDAAYTIAEVEKVDEKTINDLKSIEGVLRVKCY
ncbi:MAG: 3-phosphoglycerate dehydrogenase [Clostridia bacterium]|nr:3-phosphoglycerate dehydrogenase [Clostridia bacterium]MBQ7789529.1 3-phosphoglycerate dehydrogenase [Clostridia bacterium]